MCPVCLARFRGTRECSRCGADLTMVMKLAARAWWLREAAREAIRRHDPVAALTFATEAEEFCSTPAGRRLQALSSWLANVLTVANISSEPYER
jgi:hypothetical protein